MPELIEAYCVKCKTKRRMNDPQPVFTERGQPATRDTCAVCGSTLFRMGATPAHDGLNPGEHVVISRAKEELRKGPKMVIVESPAKARTVGKFLGRGYLVRSSVGHIRDLPQNRLGVDVENDFEPHYVILVKKKNVVRDLKEEARQASEVYLATDPDREGEAISWHLVQALGRNLNHKPVHRVEFHEITRDAIDHAFSHPRKIDMDRVNAQQARRILDRLVGYPLSSLLRDKMNRRGLSAGRVQSVAVRLVVEREREIMAFVPVEYWSIEAELIKQKVGAALSGRPDGKRQARSFIARLVKINGEDVDLKNRTDTYRIVDELETAAYRVLKVDKRERRRNPAAPFTTSTLQQEASRRLGFTAKRTMAVAQQLYEGVDIGPEGSVGLITYMRTDSTNVAEVAQAEARTYIAQRFGAQFVPPTPPVYKTRAKGAQEAHEAIRPTSTLREPQAIKAYLDGSQFRLYDLVWKRFVASQMAPAILDTTSVDITATPASPQPPVPSPQSPVPSPQSPVLSPQSSVLSPQSPGQGATEDSGLRTEDSGLMTEDSGLMTAYVFRATGSVVKFPGFLSVYEEAREEGEPKPEDEEGEGKVLPPLEAGEPLDLVKLLPEQHFTQPPPRYSEATLVRALEEYGIGRPSTYAPIISTIQQRNYVERVGKQLRPTELGFLVNDLLVEYFPEIVDVGFTAHMEEDLDLIASGERQWVPVLHDFYRPFSATLRQAEQTMPEIEIKPEPTGEKCELCGGDLVIKLGRFGKFIGCSNYPACRNRKPILVKTGAHCPECGSDIVEKTTRRKRIFYSCASYPACKFSVWKKPIPTSCPACGGLLTIAAKDTVQCIRCNEQFPLEQVEPVPVT